METTVLPSSDDLRGGLMSLTDTGEVMRLLRGVLLRVRVLPGACTGDCSGDWSGEWATSEEFTMLSFAWIGSAS